MSEKEFGKSEVTMSLKMFQSSVNGARKAGFNDALEQVAKWLDEKAHGGYAYDHDAFVYAAHVRSMKKQ